MSAEIDDITDKIRRAMECPVCLVLTGNMSCFCPNGHMVCENCLIQLWNRNTEHTCPMCRSSMVATVDLSVTSVKLSEALVMVKVACSYRKFGCAELLPVYEVNGHEAECPHKPDVRCLVTVCRWVGVFDQLFEHVSHVHPSVIVETPLNRVIVNDADTIASNRRRAYLVRTPDGMFWVLLNRERRSRIRAGVFSITNSADVVRDSTTDASLRGLTGMVYRITWKDVDGRAKKQSRFRPVGSSLSLVDDGRGDTGSYTVIRSRVGRVDIHWYHTADRIASRPE